VLSFVLIHLIDSLPAGARVLDLGARSGSFVTARTDVSIVRADLEAPAARKPGDYVRADAARLPFASRSFDAVISNHSLEHFVELDETVREIGRVVKPGGALYVAVPDATTLCDRIYRWMGRGGGHVNPFRSAAEVRALIERFTPLRHRSTALLTASLSFLNAHTFTARPPRKIAIFAFGNERFLVALNGLLRRFDRVFGTRLSVYGWAFYFGESAPAALEGSWINVCVRCGSGSSVDYLRAKEAVDGRTYRCPECGAGNWLLE
jgi:SAM-dependent methyltransferase